MTFSHPRRVEFRDTDAAGIAHFSVFFPMMEEAEHAALRHVGLSVMQPAEVDGHLTWPRVAAHCEYLSAARFEDLLRIEVMVERIGVTSVSYAFHFWRDAGLMAPECVAKGRVTAVCCLWHSGQPLKKQPIPAEVRSALERLLSSPEAAARPSG
jgi:acyl-CoA thioester hydrolase